jgi:hypothetical protein
MAEFEFVVRVECDTYAHALQVLSERTGYDEQYEDERGVLFDYSISFATPKGA